MKLAFTTLGCPDWSFDRILDEAQKMGYSSIEIRGIEGRMPADEIDYFKPGRQQDTKRLLAAHGLNLCVFGTSISFHNPDKTAEMLEDGRRTIDVCQAMDIPYVRVFGDRISKGRTVEEGAGLAVEGIEALCSYAEGTNVSILLEVHGGFNTIEVMDALIKRVKSPRFGILWDIEHSDRIYGDDFMPFYQVVRPYLKHIHVKDHLRMSDGTFQLCHLGDGNIPIRKIARTLLDDGYDGYFSLEWEKNGIRSCPTVTPSFRSSAASWKTVDEAAPAKLSIYRNISVCRWQTEMFLFLHYRIRPTQSK